MISTQSMLDRMSRGMDGGIFHSCADFENPGMSLEQAQLAKCALIARSIRCSFGASPSCSRRWSPSPCC